MERGYREHEPSRPRVRSSERRDRGKGERSYDDDVEKKFGRGRGGEDRGGRRDDDEKAGGRDGDDRRREAKREKKAKPATVAQSGEPMIFVNVNDRLGTKASIPCMASDSISESLPPVQFTYMYPSFTFLLHSF